MLYQRTVAKTFSITGIGLHSGKKVVLKLHPAPENSGIQFKRTDIKNQEYMKATAESVGATENATTIGSGKSAINTVEHLLAAFYGLGIDNCLCEVDGPEIPILDGSSAPFVFLLKENGLKKLSEMKKFLVVTRSVSVEDGDSWAKVEPATSLIIDSTIKFSHPQIKTQNKVFEFSCESFISELSRARTFGLLKDVDHLKRKGLAKGGSLDNAVILDDYKVINPEGLRFTNEFVCHKILDTLGDLKLLGHELSAKVTTFKSGHKLHNSLCRKLLLTPDAYKIIPGETLTDDIRKSFELSHILKASRWSSFFLS